MKSGPLLPGATIGILGDGQLGRMLAIAARQMGYRIAVFGPDGDNSPAGQIADTTFTAPFDDLDAVTRFAQAVDVVTFEFENVSAEAAERAAEFAPVRPSFSALHTTRNRLREKRFLNKAAGCETAPFGPITSREDIAAALAVTGLPAILKTSEFGYDGKGQRTVHSEDGVRDTWAEFGEVECVLEGFVDFAWEGSVVAARGLDGSYADYGLVRNEHANHILDLTIAPAPEATPELRDEASRRTQRILEALDYTGVLCVEFFVTGDGRLIVNELAPRPHNSGHWTIEGAATSQFEQQLRAVCGLPLGSTGPRNPGGSAAMANLLGDLWANGEPDWVPALAIPGVHLHLYGKAEARPGRKMGHITALASSPAEASELALQGRSALRR